MNFGEFLVSASLFFCVSGNDWKLDELALYKVGLSQDFCAWRWFITYNSIKKIVRTLKLYFMRVIKYESPDMPWHVDNPLSSLSSWLWCWCMMPWVDCQVVMLDLCELWRLGVEYMPQLQMYEECGCCKFKSYTCNILQPARWSAQWALWEVRLIYIYTYVHTYDTYIYIWGEAGGSPEDVGTFSLSLIDICIFCRSCIQMGGWVDVNVRCIASSEDVVTLKIVLAYRWGVGWC